MKPSLFAALLLAAASPAASQVHKCTAPDGSTVYQQQPCAGEASGETVREISITPGMPEEQRQQLEAMRAARAQQESARRQQRIAEAEGEVRRLQRENADPEKCQQAHQGLERIKASGYDMRGVDAFHYRTQIQLYCNP